MYHFVLQKQIKWNRIKREYKDDMFKTIQSTAGTRRNVKNGGRTFGYTKSP